MKCSKKRFCLLLFVTLTCNSFSKSYNNHGQTGLISIPSAEIHDEQSIYFTFNRSTYSKIGTITVTPFNWLEASYFYYRPDDLLWGSAKGLYLDKGFNVKFSYKPRTNNLPTFAVGLDDFAGTGQFTREYIASTYDFKNIKLTTGLGWGKYVGESSINNPLEYLNEKFGTRLIQSQNFDLGGTPSYDLWFRGDTTLFGGIEFKLNKIKNLSFKIESNTFDYFKYGCCGEGLSSESFEVRNNQSDVNFGLSYKHSMFGNIDFSYIKGDTWNVSFSVGFSSKRPIRNKKKFDPIIENKDFNQKKKNEFYLDLLHNLNLNKLYLQSANIEDESLSISIDSEEHTNPIRYTSRSAYISKKVAELNDFNFNKIIVGQLTRDSQINSVAFRKSDLNLYDRYPDVLIKNYSDITNVDPKEYLIHEFQPKVIFPIYRNSITPDFRTHIGSPERFLYYGLGVKVISEVQLSRNTVISANVGKSLKDNFDQKISDPNSSLPHVRTEILDYLQQSSSDVHLSHLDIETIFSPYRNIWTRVNFGYLEQMYGGVSAEILYKPFLSNIAYSYEVNSVQRRSYSQKFDFLDYKITTSHLNFAFYEPKTNILAKLSFGRYLAGDKGYTLDLSRRMPSGWNAGFFFTRTNVSAELFGEGSFDKGFYFNVPLNVFSKGYSKDSNGFGLRTMTRDGGQKLELRNRLINSFYGASFNEINENWQNFLD